MGSAASINQATAELQSSQSDISTRELALSEVIRLRNTIHSTTTELQIGWERIYDPTNNAMYYYHLESGLVQWDIPSRISKTTSNTSTTTTPAPTPTAATFIASHKLFTSKLMTASKGVVAQLRRQQLNWENDWHLQLLDYVVDLRKEVEELRKQDEKKFAKLTTSLADRAENAAQEAEANAATTANDVAQRKEDRHAKLMAKLAKKKKAHAKQLNAKKESHNNLLSKMKVSFKTQIQAHGKGLQAASIFLDKDGDGVVMDQTGGWVQLWDENEHNCYYWHAEKGSTWERPPDMEFNLHLKSLLSSPIRNTVKSLDTNLALEKWMTDNEMQAELLDDEKLEKEIGELEDELDKRRKLRHPVEVHAMLEEAQVEEEV